MPIKDNDQRLIHWTPRPELQPKHKPKPMTDKQIKTLDRRNRKEGELLAAAFGGDRHTIEDTERATALTLLVKSMISSDEYEGLKKGIASGVELSVEEAIQLKIIITIRADPKLRETFSYWLNVYEIGLLKKV